MKITFLGTSHGVPAANRYCQSMLIETGEAGYIVDAGAPVMECLLRMGYDLKKIKAVFITHMHGDHTFGIFGLLSLAEWYFKEMDLDAYFPDQEGIDTVRNFLRTLGLNGCERVRMHRMESGRVWQDEKIAVSAFPTAHLKNGLSYGYLLEAEGKKLYISGDLDGNAVDYPAFLDEEAVDAFVVECAHFPAEQLIGRLRNCKARRVIVVHVWPLSKYEVLRAAADSLPCKMELPCDGDGFEI